MYDTTKPYTKKVLELIRETWHTQLCDVHDGVYPVIEMKHNHPIIDHTDGIGTKGYYHWQQKTFKNAAIDAFAMNANDLAMYGAIPCKMQNHIFLPEDNDDAVYEIVETLVCLSKRYDVAMTGGETSIHMNMNGMDISISMTGIARPKHSAARYPNPDNHYQVGDALVGIPSSGLHSNGFTMAHKALGGFRSGYIEPTRIYSDIIRKIYHNVTALNHITGGAYTKLKPYLPKNADAKFGFDDMWHVPEPQKIFKDLFEVGITSEEMYKIFNCGFGFILGVPDEYLEYVLRQTEGYIVGKVTEGTGKIIIRSAFDGSEVSY